MTGTWQLIELIHQYDHVNLCKSVHFFTQIHANITKLRYNLHNPLEITASDIILP